MKGVLNELTIKNVQSHANTVLRLHPGVNAIIGPSDSGKTAILRAVDKLVNNRIPGDVLLSSWGGDLFVSIGEKIKNKIHRIWRRQGKGVNQYGLDNEEPFNAVGQGVPPQIAEALNLTDINFQWQLDGPFLLQSSPAEVARVLNRVANLDLIDSSLAAINKQMRKEELDLKQANAYGTELRDELDGYNWLPEAEGCLDKLIETESKLNAEERALAAAAGAIENASRVQAELQKAKAVTHHAGAVESALALAEGIIKEEAALERAEGLVHAARECEAEITHHSKLLKAAPEVDRLLAEIKRIAEEERELNRVENNIVRRAVQAKAELAEAKKLRVQLEEKFHQLMPDVCPLCGRGGNKK